MISFIFSVMRTITSLFKTNKRIRIENLVLKKENEILKRKLDLKRIHVSKYDKLFFILLNIIHEIKDYLGLFSPQTLLRWQKMLIKDFWNFFTSASHPGRKPVPAEIKYLILSMKNDNLHWGTQRISDELLKIGITLHRSTIQNILRDFRKRGKVKKTFAWKKFLEAHINSLFAMDYFVVDTILNQRFYVHFIICHKTREIVQFAITQNPTLLFLKQQLSEFEFSIDKLVYLVHDRDSNFMRVDYTQYGIKSAATSIKTPNMNAIAERFVRSVRNEALDNFILLNQKQISKIIKEYVEYYNCNRPHQGIQHIPKGKPPDITQSDFSTANIRKRKVLGGVHHHYYREVA
jgi:putative transposase